MFSKIKLLAAAVFFMSAQAAHAQYVDITVDISEQEMYVQTSEGSALLTVSTGKQGHATPVGEFGVVRMEESWFSRKYDNAPMPHSVFFYNGYAIHGTTHVEQLGRPASKGCVRLHPADAEGLFRAIQYFGPENTIIRIVP